MSDPLRQGISRHSRFTFGGFWDAAEIEILIILCLSLGNVTCNLNINGTMGLEKGGGKPCFNRACLLVFIVVVLSLLRFQVTQLNVVQNCATRIIITREIHNCTSR